MNTPNYPQGQQPQGGNPYGPPQGQQPYGGGQPPQTPPGGQPYGGPPPQTPPGGQQYGGQPPQTPPGGQPYGGPPPQGQPGGYPAAPAQAAPAEKKGGNKVLKIVIGLVVAALVVGGVLFFNRNAASNAEVGDCIKVNSADANDADIEKIDCNSDEGVYQVGAKLDSTSESCPSDFYDEYTETGRGDFKLCLMLNLDKGDCINGIDTAGEVVKADCASAEATVLEVTDSADETQCPEGSIGLAYPEPSPGRTLCMGPAQTA